MHTLMQLSPHMHNTPTCTVVSTINQQLSVKKITYIKKLVSLTAIFWNNQEQSIFVTFTDYALPHRVFQNFMQNVVQR